MHKETIEGTDLVFLGDNLVGTADTVAECISQGMLFAEHDGTVVGFRDGSYYALCGAKEFHIGSQCKRGDLHYSADNYAGFVESLSSRYKNVMLSTSGAVTEVGLINFVPGRGEWTAASSEDALQMAIDYTKAYRLSGLARAIAYNARQSQIMQSSGRLSVIRDAIHNLPKYISFVYEEGLVLCDRLNGEMLKKHNVTDGSEICMTYTASKQIGRSIVVRGEIVYIHNGDLNKIGAAPMTVTIPQDYPVFVS